MNTYNTTADTLRPPPERGVGRALLFAALIHLLLIVVIALGVHWKSHTPEAVEAELWSPTVHLAAPRPPKVEPRPEPPAPKPQPQAQPAPPPPPVAKVQPTPDNAEIALEKARKLKEQEQKRQAELLAQQQAAAKLAQEKKLARQQAAEEKHQQELAAEKRKQEALKKQEAIKARQLAEKQDEKQAEEKAAALKRKQEQARERQLAALAQQSRSDYMKSLQAQAAGTGPATSAGTAAVTSGPSGAYAARLATLVRQNVVYAQIDQIQGDPKVIITVTLDQNSGEVLGATIKRSSGVPSWDQAVLRAIQRVGRFPPDENGKWYSPMEIKAGPRDAG